jgi:hypothetical protein
MGNILSLKMKKQKADQGIITKIKTYKIGSNYLFYAIMVIKPFE